MRIGLALEPVNPKEPGTERQKKRAGDGAPKERAGDGAVLRAVPGLTRNKTGDCATLRPRLFFVLNRL